ncbi:MAG: hypothetical protein DRI90_21065, partial [Deltaproteobacteria bacterium]
LWAIVLQVGVALQRLADVVQLLLPTVTKLLQIDRLQKFISAVSNFCKLLESVDPQKWERYLGPAWDTSLARIKKQADFGSGPAKAAKLTSLRADFDITGVNTVIKVFDADGGVAKEVDFAEFLEDQPPELTLTVRGGFTKINLSGTGDGSLTLNNTVYTRVDGAWTPELSGGGFIETGTVIEKKRTSRFLAVASDDLSFTDGTFDTGTLKISTDGSSTDKPLTTLNQLTAAERAIALATLIDGTGGCAATASGETVTVTYGGLQVMTESSLGCHGQFGINGDAQGTEGGKVNAEQLAAKLREAAGSFTVEVSGDKVIVTHNVADESSYLEVSGPLATRFFSSDPATSTGTGITFFNSLARTRDILGLVSGWPGALQDAAKPVYQLLGDVMGMWGHFSGAISSFAGIFLQWPPKQGLGLIAGNKGITLGTKAGIFGVGKTITLVATDQEETPDKDKFIPVVEDLLYKFKGWNLKFDQAVRNWVMTTAPAKQGLSGFRIISGGAVHMAARGEMHILAGEAAKIYGGGSVDIACRSQATIASRTSYVELKGTTIKVGLEEEWGPQAATKTVAVAASDGQIRLTTTSLGAWLDEGSTTIQLGLRKGKDVTFDDSKPGLVIDLTSGSEKLIAGFVDSSKTVGMVVDKAGEVTVAAKGSVKLTSANQLGIEVASSGVTVTGKLDVGNGALTVMGAPVPSVLVSPPVVDLIQMKIGVVKTNHTKAILQATIVKKSIELADKNIKLLVLARDALPPLTSFVSLVAYFKADDLVEKAKEARAPLYKQLKALKLEWEQVVADAQGYQIKDILDKVTENTALFVVADPNENESGE